ncbi:MAG: glycosyltransferase [Chloroflexota bacterium]
MRVLFLLNTFAPGYMSGAEISAYHTCRGLMRDGVRCSLLVVSGRGAAQALDECYEYDGIPIHRVNVHPPRHGPWRDVFDGRVYRAVLAELRRTQPDLAHIHNVAGATLAPFVACRTARVPVVNTLHDLWLLCANNMRYRYDGSFCDPTRYPERCRQCFRRYDYWADVPFRRTLFSALTSNVRFFISPSQALIDLHARAGYDARRFRLIANGFEPSGLDAPRHARVRAVVGTAHAYQTVTFAGGGLEVKGAGVLVQAIPLMARHIERLRVVVAGGGEERFLALFRQSAPLVQTLGIVPFAEMRALFAASDLTVAPSTWYENAPVTICESLQVGTSVVASAIGGIPEMIRERETGYLFRAGDAPALAAQVISHFARPTPERRRMRWRCIADAQDKWSLDRHVDSVLRLYTTVLNS